jgi:hypothetical protein
MATRPLVAGVAAKIARPKIIGPPQGNRGPRERSEKKSGPDRIRHASRFPLPTKLAQ